jgi:hypothetical protein
MTPNDVAGIWISGCVSGIGFSIIVLAVTWMCADWLLCRKEVRCGSHE